MIIYCRGIINRDDINDNGFSIRLRDAVTLSLIDAIVVSKITFRVFIYIILHVRYSVDQVLVRYTESSSEVMDTNRVAGTIFIESKMVS